jgi:AbiV family abortive infection protein
MASNKKGSYDFTEQQLRNTIARCIENVQGLLKSAKCLLEDKSTVQYALGLYMYAVEEYGKAHLLKSHLTGKKSHILIESWIFGGSYPSKTLTSHNAKLREGFNNLPQGCEKLTDSIRFHVNTSLSPRVDIIETPTGPRPITIPAHSSGISSYRHHPTREITFDHKTFDYKTGCFYIDWDENKKEPNYIYPVEKGQLLHNVHMMRGKVVEFYW